MADASYELSPEDFRYLAAKMRNLFSFIGEPGVKKDSGGPYTIINVDRKGPKGGMKGASGKIREYYEPFTQSPTKYFVENAADPVLKAEIEAMGILPAKPRALPKGPKKA
ncbi:MAG: hypothetical protein AB1324_03400 [Candidatus Micrarchaeota archaeon]